MDNNNIITYRCPICLLIPKIVHINFNSNFIEKFVFYTLCPNNHYERFKFNEYQKLNRFSLNNNKCKNCNNNFAEYYCKECFYLLCNECKIFHEKNISHFMIIKINEIDTNCLAHNKESILYCKNCEIGLCKECIKLTKHKKHEFFQKKEINFDKLKSSLIKIKSKIPKYMENEKQKIYHIYQKKGQANKAIKISKLQIENDFKVLKKEKIDIIEFILLLIEDFINFKKKYNNKINYNLISNINLLRLFSKIEYPKHFLEMTNRDILCKNYNEIIRQKLFGSNNLNEQSFIDIKKETIMEWNFGENNIIFGDFYFGVEDNSQNIIYYKKENNLENICFKNLEKLQNFRKIEYSLKEYFIKEIKHIYINKREFILITSEAQYNNPINIKLVIMELNNNANNIIFTYNYILSEEKSGNHLSSLVTYYNNKFLLILFFDYKISFFNVFNNQLEININFGERIINYSNKVFLGIKDIGNLLLTSTEKGIIICNLNKLSIYKKYLYGLTNYANLEKIFNKYCLIIAINFKEIMIINLANDEIIQEIPIEERIDNIILLNEYSIFVSSSLLSYSLVSIITLLDGKDIVVDRNLHLSSEISCCKIKLKQYGDCILYFTFNEICLLFNKKEENNKEEELIDLDLKKMFD